MFFLFCLKKQREVGEVTAQKDKEVTLSEYTSRAQSEQASENDEDAVRPLSTPAGSMQIGLEKGANYDDGKKKKTAL